MTDTDTLSAAMTEALRPVMETAHALGFSVVAIKLAPHRAAAPAAAFAGCTTECGIGPDGHMECRVHCP